MAFMGHVITQDGLKPDPAKIQAVENMPSPTDIIGLQRLNGFVNYLAKVLPGLSDLMEPIRQLTRKNVPWNWPNTQEKALDNMTLVSEASVLRFYDSAKEITVQCEPRKRARRRPTATRPATSIRQQGVNGYRNRVRPDRKRNVGCRVEFGEIEPVHLRTESTWQSP